MRTGDLGLEVADVVAEVACAADARDAVLQLRRGHQQVRYALGLHSKCPNESIESRREMCCVCMHMGAELGNFLASLQNLCVLARTGRETRAPWGGGGVTATRSFKAREPV